MTTLSSRIKLRGGTTTQMNAASSPYEKEPWVNTTTSTLWCYISGAWVNLGAVATQYANDYYNGTDDAGGQITAAGTTTLTPAATKLHTTFNITATGGAGVYAHAIVLAISAPPLDGARVTLMLALPASTNPTITIRNATGGGTLLDTIHDTDGTEALYWTGEYVYSGSAWVKVKSGFQNA